MIRTLKSKLGKTAFVSVAVLIAIVFALNIIVTLLPARATLLDVSGTGMYTPSEISVRFIDKLKEDVKMYFLCENKTADPMTEALLKRYDDLSEHISYEVIDVAKDPKFTEKYLGIAYDRTDDNGQRPLNNGSVIIESEKRFYVIDAADLYHFRAMVNGQSYSLSVSEIFEFLNYYPASEYYTYFDADKYFLSGLDYVTLENVDTVYVLKGHGEREIYGQLYENLKYGRVHYKDFILSEHESVPETCSGMIIAAPTTDFSDSDTAKLLEYISRGGKILLITSPENASFTNLLKITEAFGMTAAEGTVHDTGLASYLREPYKLLPNPNGLHGMVSYINSYYSNAGITTLPIMPNSHAIIPTVELENGDNPLGATVTRILYTSTLSDRVIGEDVISDKPQSYAVGMSSSKTIAGSSEVAAMYWYSSYEAFTARYISSEYITDQEFVPGEVNQTEPRAINMLYLLHSLAYMGSANEFESDAVKNLVSPKVEIPVNAAIGLGMGSPFAIPEKLPKIAGTVLIIVLPLAIIATSVFVCVRRRRRR